MNSSSVSTADKKLAIMRAMNTDPNVILKAVHIEYIFDRNLFYKSFKDFFDIFRNFLGIEGILKIYELHFSSRILCNNTK